MRIICQGLVALSLLLCGNAIADLGPADKALLEVTYRHLAVDPDKAAALMRFSRPDEGRRVIAGLAKVVRDWEVLQELSVKQFEGELPEGGAVRAIGMPLRLPRNLDQFNELDDAIASADEQIWIHMVRTPDGPKWDGDRQLRLADDGAKELLGYFVPLQKVIAQVAEEVRGGRVRDAMAAGRRVDQLMLVERMKPHLSDVKDEPAPKPAPGETRMADGLGRVASLAVSADGNFAVTGAVSAVTPLRVWNLKTRKLERLLEIPAALADVHVVSFTPDGTTVAAMGVEYLDDEVFAMLRKGVPEKPYEMLSGTHRIWLFDAGTGRLLDSFRPQRSLADAMAISRDGSMLAAPSMAETYVWDLKTRKLLSRAPGGQGVAFGGGRLLVMNVADSMDIVDPQTGKSLRNVPLSGQDVDRKMNAMAVSPDNRIIAYATAYGTNLLDASGGRVRLRRLALHPPRWLGGDRGMSRVNSIQFSKDGARVVASSGLYALDKHPKREAEGLAALVATDPSRRVCLYDVASGQILKAYVGHEKTVSGASFIDDEQAILSSSTDGTLRIWPVPAPATRPATVPATAPATVPKTRPAR